jgi:hypothetical protein
MIGMLLSSPFHGEVARTRSGRDGGGDTTSALCAAPSTTSWSPSPLVGRIKA